MRGRKRTLCAVVGLLALSPGMLAMGASGRQQVQSNTKAVFVDRDGTRVQAEHVTVSGTTEIPGELGRGSLRVPFDNVASVSFEDGEVRGDRTAKIALRNDGTVSMNVRGSLLFYGQTPVGTYQIRARDLKSVEFVH